MIIFSIIGFIIVFSILTGITYFVGSIINKLAGRIVVDQAWMLLVPLCIVAIINIAVKSKMALPLGLLVAVFLSLKIPYAYLMGTSKVPEKKEYIQGISLRRGRRK